MKKEKLKEDLRMYFSPEVTRKFAQLEQNETNYKVSGLLDKIALQETEGRGEPLYVADLGAGAHPDRYHGLFSRLLKGPRGKIDWVDVSPFMLELANEYLNDFPQRREVINFIEDDLFSYLEKLPDSTLDLVMMKYVLDHIEEKEKLFHLFSLKLNPGGVVIATAGRLDPRLKSFSTNARYLYRGEEFPPEETRVLQDGDRFIIRFLRVSGDPESGYTEGAETVKYYHSPEKMEEVAKKEGLDIFWGDWKEIINETRREGVSEEEDIIILKKPY